MNAQVVNQKLKTITTYEVTNSVIESIKEMLLIFTSEENVTYSLGFQILEKLSKKKRQNLEVSFIREGLGQKEVKLFLENLSEDEFKAFKKAS